MEYGEISAFEMEYSGEKIAKQGADFLSVEFSKEEAENCEAFLAIAEEDTLAVVNFLAETKYLLSKEGMKDWLRDDKKRRIAFETLSMLSFTIAQIAGSLDPSTSEITRTLVAFAPYLDGALMYMYEFNEDTREIDLYSDDDEPLELRKERIKFFLSDRAYKEIDRLRPLAIDNIVNMLAAINKSVGNKGGRSAAQSS